MALEFIIGINIVKIWLLVWVPTEGSCKGETARPTLKLFLLKNEQEWWDMGSSDSGDFNNNGSRDQSRAWKEEGQ